MPSEARRAARPFDLAQVVRAIWHSGVDPAGTLSEKYLAQLGLPLPDDVRGRVVRHHHSLAFAKDKRMAGMLMLLRDLKDDQPVAVARTYLDADAGKVAQRRDAIIKQLAALIDAESDDKAALSQTDRELRTAETTSDLLDIERQIASLVWRGQSEGLPCEHDADCSPLAVLQVRLVTVPRADVSGTSPMHAYDIVLGGRR